MISRNSRSARSASASSKGRTAAIVATAVEARPAEIVPVAIVPVIAWDWIDIPGALVAARHARSRSFPGVGWKAVIRWLLIARQEAVSVPAWRRPFMNRRSRRDDRQQRQHDSNQWNHEARHRRSIDRPAVERRFKSECTAQRLLGSLAKRPLRGRSPQGRWICSFRTRERCHHLAVPKNEPAANDDRDAMASTRAIGAWINSAHTVICPITGRRNFFNPRSLFGPIHRA